MLGVWGVSVLAPLAGRARRWTRHCKKHSVDKLPAHSRSMLQETLLQTRPQHILGSTHQAFKRAKQHTGPPWPILPGPGRKKCCQLPSGRRHVLGPRGGIRGSQAPPGRAAGIACGPRPSRSGAAKPGLHSHTWCQQLTGAPFSNISPNPC